MGHVESLWEVRTTLRGVNFQREPWLKSHRGRCPLHGTLVIVGVRYEAHYVAFPPGSRRSRDDSLHLVSSCTTGELCLADTADKDELTRRETRASGTRRGNVDSRNEGRRTKWNCEGKRSDEAGAVGADTSATLKQTLISGGESETTPSPRECVGTCKKESREHGAKGGEDEGRGWDSRCAVCILHGGKYSFVTVRVYRCICTVRTNALAETCPCRLPSASSALSPSTYLQHPFAFVAARRTDARGADGTRYINLHFSGRLDDEVAYLISCRVGRSWGGWFLFIFSRGGGKWTNIVTSLRWKYLSEYRENDRIRLKRLSDNLLDRFISFLVKDFHPFSVVPVYKYRAGWSQNSRSRFMF